MEVVQVNHKDKSAPTSTSSTFPTNEESSITKKKTKKKRSNNMKSSIGSSNNLDDNLQHETCLDSCSNVPLYMIFCTITSMESFLL
jgi:hypothetical protein